MSDEKFHSFLHCKYLTQYHKICNDYNYHIKANVEKLTDIGDAIEVIDEPMGVDITTHVISYDYDCILGKYTELEFGNFKQKVSGLMGTVSSTIQQSVEQK